MNAPFHRVLVCHAKIGGACTKKSNESCEYLGLKLDDPSFAAPIYANLFDGEGGAGSPRQRTQSKDRGNKFDLIAPIGARRGKRSSDYTSGTFMVL